MHILMVDDNSETRTLFSLVFKIEGHTVDLAKDGHDALRLVEEIASRPDVIIMDFHMPGMTGLEAVQKIRQRQEWASVPTIFFTGDARARGTLTAQVEELGRAQVVYKPILPDQLLAIARDVVRQ